MKVDIQRVWLHVAVCSLQWDCDPALLVVGLRGTSICTITQMCADLRPNCTYKKDYGSLRSVILLRAFHITDYQLTEKYLGAIMLVCVLGNLEILNRTY